MPIYLKQGEFEEALKDILTVLGTPGACPCNACKGCKYEMQEAVMIAKAVLGEPVPRQQCKHCGALDQIWSERINNDPEDKYKPSIMSEFYCHACGEEDEGEWVEVPADKS